tara:strand:- start:2 stop:541 length:540 start_codon:yes stop_codon:yes gene_type:complete
MTTEQIFGRWRHHGYHCGDCADHFCEGCGLDGSGPSNSSRCYKTNVKITYETHTHSLIGSAGEEGNVWIGQWFKKEMEKILPPGINIISKTFVMTIMMNNRTKIVTPNTPWRCIRVHKDYPFPKGMVISYPMGDIPNDDIGILRMPTKGEWWSSWLKLMEENISLKKELFFEKRKKNFP